MTINECLVESNKLLSSKNILSSRLDTLIILEKVLLKSREWILANLDFVIDDAKILNIQNLLNIRTTHLPISYMFNTKMFYSRNFVINNDVLIPRPETEGMIDALKSVLQKEFKMNQKLNVADIGTGSGVIGITAKLECPQLYIDLIDNDEKAISNAQFNVDLFTLSLNVIKSNLLEQTNINYDILLCNLPYVPDNFSINKEASFEPKNAIFGGIDGLKYYSQLLSYLNRYKIKPLYIIIEILPIQNIPLKSLVKNYGFTLTKYTDFIYILN